MRLLALMSANFATPAASKPARDGLSHHPGAHEPDAKASHAVCVTGRRGTAAGAGKSGRSRREPPRGVRESAAAVDSRVAVPSHLAENEERSSARARRARLAISDYFVSPPKKLGLKISLPGGKKVADFPGRFFLTPDARARRAVARSHTAPSAPRPSNRASSPWRTSISSPPRTPSPPPRCVTSPTLPRQAPAEQPRRARRASRFLPLASRCARGRSCRASGVAPTLTDPTRRRCARRDVAGRRDEEQESPLWAMSTPTPRPRRTRARKSPWSRSTRRRRSWSTSCFARTRTSGRARRPRLWPGCTTKPRTSWCSAR